MDRAPSRKVQNKLAEYKASYRDFRMAAQARVQAAIPMNDDEAREAFRREQGSAKGQMPTPAGVLRREDEPGPSPPGVSRKGFVRAIEEPDVTTAEMRAHLRDTGHDVRRMDSGSVASTYDGGKEADPYTEVTASRTSAPSVQDLPDVPEDEPNPGMAFNPESELMRVAPEIFKDPGIGDLPSVPPRDVEMALTLEETTEGHLNKRLAALKGKSAAQVKRTIAAKANAAIQQATRAVQQMAAATGANPQELATAKAIYKEGGVQAQLARLPPPPATVKMTPEQLASTEHVYQRMADTLGIPLKEVIKRQEAIVAEAKQGPQSETELWERLVKLKGDPNTPLINEGTRVD